MRYMGHFQAIRDWIISSSIDHGLWFPSESQFQYETLPSNCSAIPCWLSGRKHSFHRYWVYYSMKVPYTSHWYLQQNPGRWPGMEALGWRMNIRAWKAQGWHQESCIQNRQTGPFTNIYIVASEVWSRTVAARIYKVGLYAYPVVV